MPQGSILGSFSVLVYVNGLQKVTKSSKSTFFADNTALHNAGCNEAVEMQEDLNNVFGWFVANRLTVNADKFEMLSSVGSRPINIECFGQSFSCEDSCRYLGVITDNKLCFKEHIGCRTNSTSYAVCSTKSQICMCPIFC